MSGSIWDELGVPVRSDRATIRRAYAAKLRHTNPEDDPEGFKRLRAAYDRALSLVGTAPNISRACDPSELQSQPNAAIAMGDDRSDAPQETSGAVDDLPGLRPIGSLLDDIKTMLASDDGAGQTLATTEVLYGHPALAEIRVRTEVEQALALIIVRFAPRSDALADSAARHFGWAAPGYRVRFAPIANILHRRMLWTQIADYGDRKHALHRGWSALGALAPQPRRHLATWHPRTRRQVRVLLTQILPAQPALADYLSGDAIAWWKAHLARPRIQDATPLLPLCWLQAWILVALVRGTATIGLAEAMIALPVGAVLAILYTLAIRPRLARHWRDAAPALTTKRWVAIFVAMPPLAILLPVAPISLAAGLIVMTLLSCWQGLLLASAPQPPAVTGRSGIIVIRRILIGICALPALAQVDPPAWPQWLLFLGTIELGWERGIDQITRALMGLSPWVRRAFLSGWGLALGILAQWGPFSSARMTYGSTIAALGASAALTLLGAFERRDIRRYIIVGGRVALFAWWLNTLGPK